MKKRLSDIGEFGLIELIRKNVFTSPRVIKGIGDDTAVLRADPGKILLLTTDMLIEDVHFTRKMKPFWIGHKALACNISDIAAMGGLPVFAVVSLGVPARLGLDFVTELYKGMNTLARKFRVAIVGGDTVKSDKIVINVALLGEAESRSIVKRCGAKIGDQIFVTGPLGRSFQTGRHLTFKPRIAESQFLVKHFLPTAMIDLSDGLASDLGHILEQSNVGARIYEEYIPRNPGASLQEALTDGEDFELAFTLPRQAAVRLISARRKGFHFYPIGEIAARGKGFNLVNRDQKESSVGPKGFRHF